MAGAQDGYQLTGIAADVARVGAILSNALRGIFPSAPLSASDRRLVAVSVAKGKTSPKIASKLGVTAGELVAAQQHVVDQAKENKTKRLAFTALSVALTYGAATAASTAATTSATSAAVSTGASVTGAGAGATATGASSALAASSSSALAPSVGISVVGAGAGTTAASTLAPAATATTAATPTGTLTTLAGAKSVLDTGLKAAQLAALTKSFVDPKSGDAIELPLGVKAPVGYSAGPKTMNGLTPGKTIVADDNDAASGVGLVAIVAALGLGYIFFGKK